MTLPIITYHAIGDERSPIWTKVSTLEAQLDALISNGYHTVPLTAAIDQLRAGTLSDRAVVLTFDDGYASVATLAWPRLYARGLVATVFVVSDYCGRDNDWPGQPSLPVEGLLSWDQVQVLAAHGWEIGAHTATHPALPLLPIADAEREICASMQVISETIDRPVTSFAYPYGATSPEVTALVRRQFSVAVGTRLGLADDGDDSHELPRLDAHYLRPDFVPYLSTPIMRQYLRGRDHLRSARRRLRPDWDMTPISRGAVRA